MVDLGFTEKCESWQLESRFFPSKVGGKPAWLDLKNIPQDADLACEYCGEPCTFLCQVYAPYEDNDAAFHRTIYIFICKKVDCCKVNKSGNIKVFRSQLSKINEYYPPDPPVEDVNWRPEINSDAWTKTCHVCGLLAPNHCSKCKTTNYCCRVHQLYDWKHGHKKTCGTNEKMDLKFLFPEYELVIEAENNATDCKSNSDEETGNSSDTEVEIYKNMVKKGDAGVFQNEDVQNELTNMCIKEDETFSNFHSKVGEYPDQVLRYNRGGEILYISAENKIKDVPKCQECNGIRQFEFQIMPQLLNYLGLEDTLKSIDWGVLLIFTCAKSCISQKGYISEYIWKQDIVEVSA